MSKPDILLKELYYTDRYAIEFEEENGVELVERLVNEILKDEIVDEKRNKKLTESIALFNASGDAFKLVKILRKYGKIKVKAVRPFDLFKERHLKYLALFEIGEDVPGIAVAYFAGGKKKYRINMSELYVGEEDKKDSFEVHHK